MKITEHWPDDDSNKKTVITNFITQQSSAKGRYEVYCQWEKVSEAHVFIVERTKENDLIWFDPQSGRRGGVFDDYVDKMLAGQVKIRRVDDQLINPKFAERLLKARK